MAYIQLLRTAEMLWEEGIAAGITQKSVWSRGESNSHGQVTVVRMEPGIKSPGHRHPHPQLFYTISGTGRVWLDEDGFEIQSGDMVRVLGGEYHEFENTGQQPLVMIELQLFDMKIDLRKISEARKKSG